MEDIANTEQRPKVEDYGDQLFIVARMLTLSEDGRTLSSEQCSLVLGKNFCSVSRSARAAASNRCASGCAKVTPGCAAAASTCSATA
jgi:Mg2+ and Co2+ transporter CorA